MPKTLPPEYADLLERPIVGVLATVSADGVPNATPMWFLWDGEHLKFTHTAKRRKVANLRADPRFSFVVTDPDNPYRYLEVRGVLDRVVEDPTGAFFVVLGKRYGNAEQQAPPDSPDRIVLELTPTYFGVHG